jgi:hypothetical protein
VAAELFHEDRQTGRQTDMMKLIFAFRKFVSVPKVIVKQVECEDLNWLLASDRDW